MSALAILECNACGAVTPPWPTIERAREEAAPDGWAVEVDGEDVDYCPTCTAPARPVAVGGQVDPVAGRLVRIGRGIKQLRDVLHAIATTANTMTPQAMSSVASLAVVRADELLAELRAA